MKKLAALFACLIGVLFFASCEEQNFDDILAQKPSIAFLSGEGYCSQDGNYYVDTVLNFKVQATPNATSEAPLYGFNFSIDDLNGHNLVDTSFTVDTDTLLFTRSFQTQKAGVYIVTATVTDTAGKINSAELKISLVDPTANEIAKYAGYVSIVGDITFDTTTMPDQHVAQDSIPTLISLNRGTQENEVVAVVGIEGTPYPVTCIQEGNQLSFESFHITRTLPGANVELDMVISMSGTLEGDQLTVNGPVTGTGDLNLFIMVLHADMTGQIDGVLEKVEEEPEK